MLREANLDRIELTGHPLAGFSTLVASVSKEIELSHTGEVVKRKAWEFLTHGEITELLETEEEKSERFEELSETIDDTDYEIKLRARVFGQAKLARRCFGVKACRACRKYRSKEALQGDDYVEAQYRKYYYSEKSGSPFDAHPSFESWVSAHGLVAFGCLEADGQSPTYQEKSSRYQEDVAELRSVQRSSRSS